MSLKSWLLLCTVASGGSLLSTPGPRQSQAVTACIETSLSSSRHAVQELYLPCWCLLSLVSLLEGLGVPLQHHRIVGELFLHCPSDLTVKLPWPHLLHSDKPNWVATDLAQVLWSVQHLEDQCSGASVMQVLQQQQLLQQLTDQSRRLSCRHWLEAQLGL